MTLIQDQKDKRKQKLSVPIMDLDGIRYAVKTFGCDEHHTHYQVC